jgi:2-polyprenyl-3-methyl-5-hydroxy-6-metoxy-1,4-benzoquinol methylase
MPDALATCAYCGAEAQPSFRTRDYNRRVDVQEFQYLRCPRCELVFLHPQPDDFGHYYPADYYALPVSLEQLALWAEHERYKLDLVTCFVKGGTLLEIGPATGGFAYLAKQAGFKVRVIEMSLACCDFLSQVVGVDATNTSDELAALEASEPVDVIALWHVIEHLHNPFALIFSAARRLKPGGIIVIAAPNPAAWQFRLQGNRWPHVDAPRHAFLIPIVVLSGSLERAGLQPLLKTTRDTGSLGWNQFGWEYWIGNRFRGPRLQAGLRRIGRLVSKVMSPLERIEGLGAAYTVIYQCPNR